MRRLLGVFALAGGAVAGLALLRRGRSAARERVDLYFDDGSMVSFASTTSEAARLLPLARRVLASARG
jgi:acetyl-CoA carboxylase carboxyltransferase component